MMEVNIKHFAVFHGLTIRFMYIEFYAMCQAQIRHDSPNSVSGQSSSIKKNSREFYRKLFPIKMNAGKQLQFNDEKNCKVSHHCYSMK